MATPFSSQKTHLSGLAISLSSQKLTYLVWRHHQARKLTYLAWRPLSQARKLTYLAWRPFPSQKTHFSGRGRRDLILLGGPFASQEHDSSGLAVIAQSGLRPRLGGQAHLKPQHDHSGSAAAFQARKLCHLAWPSLQTIDPHWCSGISQANRLMDMALRLCLEPADRFAWQMSGGVQIQISFSTFSNTCDMVWRHSTRAHTRYLDVWERLFISE